MDIDTIFDEYFSVSFKSSDEIFVTLGNYTVPLIIFIEDLTSCTPWGSPPHTDNEMKRDENFYINFMQHFEISRYSRDDVKSSLRLLLFDRMIDGSRSFAHFPFNADLTNDSSEISKYRFVNAKKKYYLAFYNHRIVLSTEFLPIYLRLVSTTLCKVFPRLNRHLLDHVRIHILQKKNEELLSKIDVLNVHVFNTGEEYDSTVKRILERLSETEKTLLETKTKNEELEKK